MRFKKIRAAAAKEVEVGNPAEETTAAPNQILRLETQLFASSFEAHLKGFSEVYNCPLGQVAAAGRGFSLGITASRQI